MDNRASVLKALKLMAERDDVFGSVGSHGNVSVFNRKEGVVYIKPSGVPFADFYLEDQVCAVDFITGKLLSGSGRGGIKLKPSVDTIHHLAIYANHPWVNSVVHSHSPFVLAFAALGRDLKCYFSEMADTHETMVRCLEYAGVDEWGAEVKLEESKINPGHYEKAVLLEQHGSIVVGEDEDPVRCVESAIKLEELAHKTYLVHQLQMCFMNHSAGMNMNRIEEWSKRFKDGRYGQGK